MKEKVLIMPCLDMQNGKVVKGVHFVDIAEVGDVAECAKRYCDAGADELALLDITATIEKRKTLTEVVKKVAAVCTVPFTVGGGINSLEIAREVLDAGADKVSISSAAFRDENLVKALLAEFGPAKVTIAIDVDKNSSLPSGYEVYIDGGRTATNVDAVEFAKKVYKMGIRSILPTSKAGDGAKTGYDLPIIRQIKDSCPEATVVASGGAGKMQDFVEAAQAGATILLAASVFHYRTIDIQELKAYLKNNDINVN